MQAGPDWLGGYGKHPVNVAPAKAGAAKGMAHGSQWPRSEARDSETPFAEATMTYRRSWAIVRGRWQVVAGSAEIVNDEEGVEP